MQGRKGGLKVKTMRNAPNYKRPSGSDRKDLGRTSFTLHNVVLVNEEDQELISSLIKTFCSASRCAVKRFQAIDLNSSLLKKNSHSLAKSSWDGRLPNKYNYCAPDGMSDQMWYDMRRDSYASKVRMGEKRANMFWRMDKAMGCPISSTQKVVGEWVEDNGFKLDATLLHESVLAGIQEYKAFASKQNRWQTSKSAPCFGDMVQRSQHKIDHQEFEVSKNPRLVVTGKARGGNSKFHFDPQSKTMTFTYARRKIQFSYAANRFSKKGLRDFTMLISAMKFSSSLPVTVSLIQKGSGRFNVSLTYCKSELDHILKQYSKQMDSRVSAIYYTNECICHVVKDVWTDKILHARTYRMDAVSGMDRAKGQIERLEFNKEHGKEASARKRVAHRLVNATHDVLNEIYRVNRSLCVSKVVVERPCTRTKRNFNNGYIVSDRMNVGKDVSTCFMSAAKFVGMVKSQCTRNGMMLCKEGGAFLQALAIMDESTQKMNDAMVNACVGLISRSNRPFGTRADDGLTDLAGLVGNPSLLVWVSHLLHNKRKRQARFIIRKSLNNRIVEKAIRLCDGRSGTASVEGCDNTASISGGLLV